MARSYGEGNGDQQRVVDRRDVAQLDLRDLLGAFRAEKIEIDVGVVGKNGAAQAPDDALAPDAVIGDTKREWLRPSR